MSTYFLYKGRLTRRYFELKQTRLSPFWYVKKHRQTTCISGISIRNNPNIANTMISWMPSAKPALHTYLLLDLWTFVFLYTSTYYIFKDQFHIRTKFVTIWSGTHSHRFLFKRSTQHLTTLLNHIKSSVLKYLLWWISIQN